MRYSGQVVECSDLQAIPCVDTRAELLINKFFSSVPGRGSECRRPCHSPCTSPNSRQGDQRLCIPQRSVPAVADVHLVFFVALFMNSLLSLQQGASDKVEERLMSRGGPGAQLWVEKGEDGVQFVSSEP